jgi:hypothetical protein
MKNRLFFISIESIESLESVEPQYRFGLESVDTEKSVSIDSSSLRCPNFSVSNVKIRQSAFCFALQ